MPPKLLLELDCTYLPLAQPLVLPEVQKVYTSPHPSLRPWLGAGKGRLRLASSHIMGVCVLLWYVDERLTILPSISGDLEPNPGLDATQSLGSPSRP